MPNARNLAISLIFMTNLAANAAPADDFQALLDESWEWQLVQSPVFASSLGDRRFNDKWADLSIEAIETRHQQRQDFLDRLRAIDASGLNDQLRSVPPRFTQRHRWPSVQRLPDAHQSARRRAVSRIDC
jgi:uncharacterized protein (DUF885 family)